MCALNPTILLINSDLNPFITDITIIKTATPKLIPVNENKLIKFKKLSFFWDFKNLNIIFFSSIDINVVIFFQFFQLID